MVCLASCFPIFLSVQPHETKGKIINYSLSLIVLHLLDGRALAYHVRGTGLSMPGFSFLFLKSNFNFF